MSIHCDQRDRTRPNDSTAIIGYYGDERIFLQEYWGMEATYLIFLPLVEGMFGYEEPQPALAERWEYSEDYREWTFYLRSDVKWHDGMPVTAQDIKFTFDLRKKLNLSEGSVEILDEYVFKITYPKPKNGLDTYDVYYPKHLLDSLNPEEFYDWDFWTHPIGNGPYRYVRHVPKTIVELEANPDYYSGEPKINKVILKFIENSLTELISGNIDAAEELNSLDLLKIEKDPRFHAYYRWGNTMSSIYWNHNHSLFHSPEIRQALTLAINRLELAEVLNYPENVPLRDTITTGRQFRQGVYPEPLPYDPDQASEILERHGWNDTDRDGIRERKGKDFQFLVLISSSLQGSEEISTYIQDQFRRIGVRMQIQALESNLLKQRIDTGDFEALLFLIHGSLTQPRFGDVKLFGRESPLGYKNPEMIQLLDMAMLEVDPDKLDSIYQNIMPIFIKDMPMTLLLPWPYTTIVHRRIKGLSNHSMVDPVRHMEHLWIEEEPE
jgi:peptide/nickel transport system substrate-binding protein